MLIRVGGVVEFKSSVVVVGLAEAPKSKSSSPFSFTTNVMFLRSFRVLMTIVLRMVWLKVIPVSPSVRSLYGLRHI